MRRFRFLIALPGIVGAALFSCGGGGSFEFPAQAGTWKLEAGSVVSTDSTFSARYLGEAPISVTVQATGNESAAFEMVQKSRPAPGVAYSYRGRFFITAKSGSGTAKHLSEFLNQFESTLPR